MAAIINNVLKAGPVGFEPTTYSYLCKADRRIDASGHTAALSMLRQIGRNPNQTALRAHLETRLLELRFMVID